MSKISVITVACNQGDWVRQTIPKIHESLDGWDHEVLVVDDHSSDGCCDGLGQDIIRILPMPDRLGITGARQYAAQRATGDIFLYTDPHCEYATGALWRVCQKAEQTRAIVQPPTVVPEQGQTAPRYGGYLYVGDRGLMIGGSKDWPADYPALLGTVYAMHREVHDHLQGWPVLPGVWSYAEQALTLAAYFAGVPIHVLHEERLLCQHHDNHPKDADGRGRHTCRVTKWDMAANAKWCHAMFFPRSFANYWKPILDKRFGEQGDDALLRDDFERRRRPLKDTWIKSEERFFKEVLESSMPEIGGKTLASDQYLDQQRSKSKPQKYPAAAQRTDATLRWMLRALGRECLRDKYFLDLGVRDGYSTKWLIDHGAHGYGLELVPETAQYAKERGLPVCQGDMQNLREDDIDFDLVVALHCLEHCQDAMAARAEMIRVLRPGGWLLVAVPQEAVPNKRHAHNVAFPRKEAIIEFLLEDDRLTDEGMCHRWSTMPDSKSGQREFRVLVKKRDQ